MAIPVGSQDVERVLRPWLGTLFLSSNTFLQRLVKMMQEYAPYRQTLEDFHCEMEGFVITELKKNLGGEMSVVLDHYGTARIGLLDIKWMTDDVMGVLFDRLTPFSANFTKLNDYALHVESLAALRVLYQKYMEFFTPEEYRFLVEIIRRTYPAHRYEAWLSPQD